MLWFNNRNVVKLGFIHIDEDTHKVRASASIRNKKADGTSEWISIDVRFSAKANAEFLLKSYEGKDATGKQKRVDITILDGGVDLYLSKVYMNKQGKPLVVPTLVVNDFEIKNWDNASPQQPRPQAAPAQPTPAVNPPLPWEDSEVDNPF